MHKLVLLLFFVHIAFALDDHLMNSPSIASQRSVSDRAVGFATRGGIENASVNNGNFSHYALTPSGADENYQYLNNLSFILGLPGRSETGASYPWALRSHPDFPDTLLYFGPTVSESWFDRSDGYIQTDWEAVDNSYGELFSGDLTAGDAFSDFWTVPEDPRALLAHSDLPESWPSGGEGSYWPGMDGSVGFIGERDIYFEFTDDPYANRDEDQTQGYPTQVKVLATVSDFDNPIYEDAILIRMQLVNESEWDYENVFSGFYFDVDSYSRLRNGRYTGRSNDDDMMAFDTETNSTFIWDFDGMSNGAADLQHVGLQFIKTPTAPYDIDFDDDGTIDVNQDEMLGLSSWRWFDWYTRPGVLRDESGGSSCPDAWAGGGGCPGAIDKEAIQYALIAGNLDYPNELFTDWEWRGIPSGTPNMRAVHYDQWYFQPDSAGATHQHFDGSAALNLQQENWGRDCLLMVATGPFDFPSGDTLDFEVAIVFGRTNTPESMSIPLDLKRKMDRLKGFVDMGFQEQQVDFNGLSSHSEHIESIDLEWSYESMDALPQDQYAVRFKGENERWDAWRNYNGSDNTISLDINNLPDYPWYSIQLIAGSNDIFGYTQIDSIRINNPGNSPPFGYFVLPQSGEFISGNYSIDWDVLDLEGDEVMVDLYFNPIEYSGWVLIEEGLPNEPFLWDSRQAPNSNSIQLRLDVSDGDSSNSYYSDFFQVENERDLLPDSMVSHVSGVSNALVSIVVADESDLRGHEYAIECFAETLQTDRWDQTQMRIIDVTTQDTLFAFDRLRPYMQTPYFHGLRLEFFSWPVVEVDSITWNRTTPAFDLQMEWLGIGGKPGEYLIAFSEMGVDSSFQPGFMTPFQIFNLIDDPIQNLEFGYIPINGDREWQVGEPVFIREHNSQAYVDSSQMEFTWRILTTPETGASWSPGDSVFIKMNIPLQRDDRYEFSTRFTATDKAELLPQTFKLLPCYPNPFNATVTIPFQSPGISNISIVIYDLKGRVVWENSSSETVYAAGEHNIFWKSQDHRGKSAASGVYIIAMQAENFSMARKVLLLK